MLNYCIGGKTSRKPLAHKELRQIFAAKFSLSTYAATTYVKFGRISYAKVKYSFLARYLLWETLRYCKETTKDFACNLKKSLYNVGIRRKRERK